jgi:hypothetical protein
MTRTEPLEHARHAIAATMILRKLFPIGSGFFGMGSLS